LVIATWREEIIVQGSFGLPSASMVGVVLKSILFVIRRIYVPT